MIAWTRFTFFAIVLLLVLGFAVPTKAESTHVIEGKTIASVGESEARHLLHDTHYGLVCIPVADQQVPAGHVTLRAQKPQSYGETYVNVPITILVQGHVVRQILAGYRIVRYVMRPIATYDLPQGHVISNEDLVMTKVPDNGAAISLIPAFIGRVLTSQVVKGQTPQLWQTMTQIIVHSGEPVVLVIRDGDVSLSDDVVARSSGGVGDSIIVYDEHADRAINAVITAPGEVELQLPGGNS